MMNSAESTRPMLRVLLTWASLVVIIAGMKAATELVVPFLLSLFLAIMSGPALQALQKRGFPQWLSMLVVLAGLSFAVIALATMMGTTVSQFIEVWPKKYQPRIVELVGDFNAWIDQITNEWAFIKQLGIESWVQDQKIGQSGGEEGEGTQWLEPDFINRMLLSWTRAVSGLLSKTLLILITTLFLIFEASVLPAKLKLISGDSASQYAKLQQVAADVNSYMAIKTSTSLLTGGIVTVGLWLLGVEFPLLWGLLAFLLNYVPNIGSILAAVPAVLLTLLGNGVGTAAIVIGLYVAVNMFIGYIIEPRWMGRGLGLSTLVVFLSLVFWGWVLGPIGMVISVPLTMAVKIVLENNEETRWVAVLMGSGTSQPKTS
ncbi:MAG: AI-2E family transporter [Planctomycetaceae bacterium]|nr:AI-2E family transporter [Planctomycetaceae bacterium]